MPEVGHSIDRAFRKLYTNVCTYWALSAPDLHWENAAVPLYIFIINYWVISLGDHHYANVFFFFFNGTFLSFLFFRLFINYLQELFCSPNIQKLDLLKLHQTPELIMLGLIRIFIFLFYMKIKLKLIIVFYCRISFFFFSQFFCANCRCYYCFEDLILKV